MIQLTNVKKSFGNVRAVDEVSFETKKGEIFGLIGPNGAGKTTTIRMIMNILAPDTGTIMFEGRPLTEDDKARIGYLPEERGLYKKVTVNDMLLYLGELKDRSRAFLQERIDHRLKQFDLLKWKDHKIDDLSKGMSQKVQFVAAVAHEPDLLFFDEPFAGLDPVSSDLLRESLLELKQEGKTVLFSTHIMEQAEKLCSRIFLINKGREVVSGPLADIKAGHGSRTVVIEFDGDGSFIPEIPGVASASEYPRWMELELEDDARPDGVLSALVGRVSVRKFEVVSPSLHSIFVQLVKTPGEEIHE